MRINKEHQTMDMESRDFNYILPAYLRSYRYYMQNEDPKEIVFPMFASVVSPSGMKIPVRYIPPDSPMAEEIAKDGSNIPEVPPEEEETVLVAAGEPTAEEIALAQEKPPDAERFEEKDQAIKEATDTIKKSVEERQPKQPPGGDLGAGHPDGMGSRDTMADRHIKKDLQPEAVVDESKELDVDIEKPTEQ